MKHTKIIILFSQKNVFLPRKIAKIKWTLVSGLSRGRKMLMNIVIIILKGTVTVNVFVVFTRNCRWSYFSHTGKDEDLGRSHNSINVYRASSCRKRTPPWSQSGHI